MIKSVLLFLAFFASLARLSAQEVLWANRVLEKSSETVDEKFSPKHRAVQALGPPSVLPLAVSSACSWRPVGTSFGEDYIKVGFEKAIRVKQIIVGESVGPGAVGRIFGYTADNKEILLFENKGNNTRRRPGIWNEIIPETEQEITAIKLLIVHSLSKGPKEYDCIGISGSSEPYVARVNVAEGLPPDLEKINLGGAVNSRYSEVAPLVSPDGKYLYFARLDHPKNFSVPDKNGDTSKEPNLDVWVSGLSGSGQWGTARNMSTSIHNSSKNAAATIAMDGKSVFALNVELSPGKYDAGLTKVSLKNNKWVNKRPLNITDFEALGYYNNSDRKVKRETEFSMSSDERFLVMGLVRKETFGDKDLYVSFRTAENTYSKPVNLGPSINTAGNEGSPFLAADNKTLYFNSNGHPGYGDMDIFMSTRLDDTWTNWSEPVNLGPHINSPQFDGYISIPASGEYAYFSSAKNSMGLDDIFKVKLFPSVKPEAVVLWDFKFTDQVTLKEIRPEISLVRVQGNKKVDFISDDETGFFKTILQVEDTYTLSARLNGYQPFSMELDLKGIREYKEMQTTYEMRPLQSTVARKDTTAAPPPPKERRETAAAAKEAPMKKPADSARVPESVADLVLEAGRKLVLREVYFDQSKAELREESFAELDRIRKIMMENPTMEILLEGHTDNQGDAALNFKLAEQRITNVKNYLTADGQIAPARIAVKSWGQYRPLQKNTSEEARRKNRRVEFTITKM